MEQAGVILCCLCEKTAINILTTPHHLFHERYICTSCVAALSSDEYLLSPPNPSSISSTLSNIYPHTVSYAIKCEEHCKKLKLQCAECNESVCYLCLENHTSHKLTSLKELVEIEYSRLRKADYILEFCLAGCRDKTGDLHKLKRELEAFLKSLENKEVVLVITDLNEFTEDLYSDLKDLNTDFTNFTLEDAYSYLTEDKKNTESVAYKDLFHWLEWGSTSIHLLNLRTHSIQSKGLADDFTIPYYCRSVLIPDGRVFLCGGRDTPNDFGRRECWIMDLETFRPEIVSDMSIGRSNHWVLYYKGYVYVIGGCDNENHFTNACERYNIETNSWHAIASTNRVTDSVCAVVIEEQSCFYTFGGREDNGFLNDTIEKYYVEENRWELLKIRLPYKSHLCGAAILPGESSKILVFGGQNESSNYYNTSCIFDYKEMTIEETEPMKNDGGCIVNSPIILDNEIITSVFEGYYWRTYQRYDVSEKLWFRYDIYSRQDLED